MERGERVFVHFVDLDCLNLTKLERGGNLPGDFVNPAESSREDYKLNVI